MTAPRIAILGLHLEANSFAPPTVREDFLRQCWEEGEAITRLARVASHLPSEVAGFYARMDEKGPWTPVPVIMIAAPPGGPIVQDVFLAFLDRARRGLAAALPLDAVYIASHGASSATGDEDSDGTLAEMVRQVVGPAVPVVVTHDLHCNVSERLVELSDAMIAYRTNPHVDMRARAAEAADMIERLRKGRLGGGMRPAKAFIRMPLMPPNVMQLTASGPYADLIDLGQELCVAPILNVSVTGGFTYGDLPKCGLCITVTADGDAPGAQDAAMAVARRIARAAWAGRERFIPKLTTLGEAVAIAAAASRGERAPVILADCADNPGGGGRGNTTWILRALHEAGVGEGVVLGVFVDPALAAQAHAAGVGATLRAAFASDESEFSRRFEAEVAVERLSDGRGIGRRGIAEGRVFDLGPCAVLRLAGSGLLVVVGSLRRQLAEPVMLEMHGIDIAAQRAVVVKSRGHFRAGFDEFFPPERIFEVDVPGYNSPVLANFAWKRLPRPAYPIDLDAGWTDNG
jgi:microcystin degradation protein MlrC